MALLSTEEGGVLVDTHFAHPYIASLVREGVSELLDGRTLRFIVNTHYHPDHTGGNALVSGTVPVVAHTRTRLRLTEGTSATGLVQPGQTLKFAPREQEGLPDSTFQENLTLNLGTGAARLWHVPNAHTDGDAVVIVEQAGVTVVGDLIWPGSFPSIDLDNGGSALGLRAAVRELIETLPAETLFITGHGSVLELDEVSAYERMLTSTIEFVQSRLEAGAAIESIIAGGLPAEWDDWASPLVPEAEWIRMIAVSGGPAGQDRRPTSLEDGVWSTLGTDDGLPEKEVRALFEDHAGKVWFGTRSRGAAVYHQGKWSYFDTNTGLAANGIAGFAQLSEGELYAVGARGYAVYDEGAWRSETAFGMIEPRVVFGIRSADNGELMMATSSGAAVGGQGAWRIYTTKDGLAHNVVHDVYRDRAEALWFACRRGLVRLDGDSMEVFHPSVNFGSILEDDSGRLWFGTRSQGTFTLHDGEWSQHRPGGDVRPAMQDLEGRIWAVSDDGGVYVFDGVDWSQFMRDDGLASNTVYDIIQTRDGSFWFATDAGVSRLNLR